MKPFIPFVLLSFALASCSGGNVVSSPSVGDSSSASSEAILHEVTYEVSVVRNVLDYEDKEAIYCLWGECAIPPYMAGYIDLSSLAIGDAITLKFTGDWVILETYPSFFRIESGSPLGASVTKGDIVEVDIRDGEIIAPEWISLDHMSESAAIGEGYRRVSMEGLSKGYLSCSAINKGEARAIYAFDPRVSETKAPFVTER